MKNRILLVFLALVLVVSLAAFAACKAEEEAPPVEEEAPPVEEEAPPVEVWEWPERMHAVAVGTTAQVQMVSYLSLLDAETGMTVRIQPEAVYATAFPMMKENKATLADAATANYRSCVEAISDYADRDSGPWMAGIVWITQQSNMGFMVRGDSDLYTPRDIKPGAKLAISDLSVSMRNNYLALLKWAGLTEEQVTWVVAGTIPASMRAVVDGRADICLAAPVMPQTFEAAAAPSGIRFLEMNPKEDPEGAAAYLTVQSFHLFSQVWVGPEDVHGTWMPGGSMMLLSNYDSDPDLIYHIVKWLDENFDLYKDKYDANKFMTLANLVEVLETDFVPAHPGLVRYLKEKELWTPAHEERNKFNIAWIQEYIDAYDEAMTQADSKGIKVASNNEAWIELWENMKKDKEIPMLSRHTSLTQNAAVRLPTGYVAPAPAEEEEEWVPPAEVAALPPITFEAVTADLGGIRLLGDDLTPYGPNLVSPVLSPWTITIKKGSTITVTTGVSGHPASGTHRIIIEGTDVDVTLGVGEVSPPRELTFNEVGTFKVYSEMLPAGLECEIVVVE